MNYRSQRNIIEFNNAFLPVQLNKNVTNSQYVTVMGPTNLHQLMPT